MGGMGPRHVFKNDDRVSTSQLSITHNQAHQQQHTFFLMSEILFLHIDGKMGGLNRLINNFVEEKIVTLKIDFLD